MVRFIDKFATTRCLTLGHYYVVESIEGKYYRLKGVNYKYPIYYFE